MCPIAKQQVVLTRPLLARQFLSTTTWRALPQALQA